MVEEAAEAAEAAQKETTQWKERYQQQTNKMAQLEQRVPPRLPHEQSGGAESAQDESHGRPHSKPPVGLQAAPDRVDRPGRMLLIAPFNHAAPSGARWGLGVR